MIYLDNAATSFPKPQQVYDNVLTYMQRICANPGRSSHEMARASAIRVMKTRESLSDLFNAASPLQFGFALNATHALNMAIHGVLNKGDHVITTAMEHNSVLRPLYELKKNGIIDYTVVMPRDEFGWIDPKDISEAVRPNTRMIVVTASSNVTGIVLPYEEIGEIAGKHGIIYLVDASQGAGVLPFDVRAMKISMLAFPGHKGLLGPQGTGALYVDESISLRPVIQGGTGSRSFETIHPLFMPDILESGTLNTPGIAGLGAGVEFIKKTGIKRIFDKKDYLVKILYERIVSNKKIKLYSSVDKKNSGIISLLIEGFDSSEIANILDAKYKIAVRSGFHCAPLAHKALGTEKTGLVRISPGYFNTKNHMLYAAECLLEIADNKRFC
jgi:cysteine desulfurase/selenocysteine lyase